MNTKNLEYLLHEPEVALLSQRALNELAFGIEFTRSQYDAGTRLTARGPVGSGIYFSVSADAGEYYTAAALMFVRLMERGILTDTALESILKG